MNSSANQPNEEKTENGGDKARVAQQCRRGFKRDAHHALHRFREYGVKYAFYHQYERERGREVDQLTALFRRRTLQIAEEAEEITVGR